MEPAHDAFDIDLDLVGEARVVTVRGEVDLDTAERFAEGLRRAVTDGRGPVVVDLSDVSFMDSTGLHLLLNALRRLTRQRRRLAVACRPSAVRRMFELTRLDETLDVHDSRADALAALERPGGLGLGARG